VFCCFGPGWTFVSASAKFKSNGSCHGIVPCDMSPNDVRPLDLNMVNGSWSVHKGEVSCMEVNSVLLHGAPRYNDVFDKL